jgi:hypothetical protein
MKSIIRLALPVLCLLAAISLPSPTTVFASTLCGSCSFRGCAGATEGRACTTFAGTPGTCVNTGKLCGDHLGYCGCYAS